MNLRQFFEEKEIPMQIQTAEKTDPSFFLALDLGTTTLALAFVSRASKKVLRVMTRNNPQCLCGTDVISRISYAMENSSEHLQRLLIREINRMIEGLLEAVSVLPDLYVAGNTTMLHLLFGEDCSGLGMAPYTPVFLEGRRVKGEALGLRGVRELVSLPCISAFVGADIVAGLHSVGMPSEGKYELLIDLGTNAEIVLCSGERIVCTSAAAGPCFEGAEISCGMSATAGAVCGFRLTKDGERKTEVIGGKEAVGICGTGLVDVVAELLKNGIVDETGYMESGEFSVAEQVTLTQEDIRQFQLAKAAVYAGTMSLMKWEKVSPEQVEQVYIAGGFSAKLNIENAVYVGLLPEELKEKCIPADNTSLLGTIKYGLEQEPPVLDIGRAEYVDLSGNTEFSKLFVRHMLFEQETE